MRPRASRPVGKRLLLLAGNLSERRSDRSSANYGTLGSKPANAQLSAAPKASSKMGGPKAHGATNHAACEIVRGTLLNWLFQPSGKASSPAVAQKILSHRSWEIPDRAAFSSGLTCAPQAFR